MQEIWKEVAGYEDKYLVSNYGNILSKYNGKLRKLIHLTGDPYLSVVLRKDNKQHVHRVHRLVALSFLENPDCKPCVNHLDLCKINNKLDNLEWSTYKENTQHMVKLGVNNPPRGERQGNAVLTEVKVLAILHRLAKGDKAKYIAHEYNVNRHQLSKIKSGKHWAYVSFDRSVFKKSSR